MECVPEDPMRRALFAIWQRRRDKAIRNSKIVDFRITLLLLLLRLAGIACIVVLLVDWLVRATASRLEIVYSAVWLPYHLVLLAYGLCAWVIASKIIQTSEAAERFQQVTDKLRPIPSSVRDIWVNIEELCRSMAFDSVVIGRIRVWLDPRDVRAVMPSVTESTSVENSERGGYDFGCSINVVLPLGFVKVLKEDAATAKAVLAHEFGHVLHGDSNMWQVANSYTKFMTRSLVPFSIIFFFILPWSGLLSDNATPSKNRNHERIGNAGKGLLSSLVVGPLLATAFFYSLRRFRRDSEVSADLAGAVFGDPDGLRQALLRYGGRGSWVSFFSIHPSAKYRIHQLDKHLAMASKSLPSSG